MRERQMLILILAAACAPSVWCQAKPDFTISIVGMERYEDSQQKGFKISAKTLNKEPAVKYRAICGVDASRLQVGVPYAAAEAYTDQDKMLLIFGVYDDPKKVAMACDVESVTTEESPRR